MKKHVILSIFLMFLSMHNIVMGSCCNRTHVRNNSGMPLTPRISERILKYLEKTIPEDATFQAGPDGMLALVTRTLPKSVRQDGRKNLTFVVYDQKCAKYVKQGYPQYTYMQVAGYAVVITGFK